MRAPGTGAQSRTTSLTLVSTLSVGEISEGFASGRMLKLSGEDGGETRPAAFTAVTRQNQSPSPSGSGTTRLVALVV